VPPRKSTRSRTIGAVLAELKDDFPDISVSKIRFLESAGLLTPQRTGAGYRSFSPADVDRLRYILTAQQERFWPLKVIREALDALDRGLAPETSAGGADGRPRPPRAAADPDVPTPRQLAATSDLRVTGPELCAAAGLDQRTFEALGTFGLLRPDARGHYDADALAVARAAGALAGYGVEPRHLRPFRTAADREIGLVQQIVSPARATSRRRGAPDPTPQVLSHCIALHTALLRAGIRA